MEAKEKWDQLTEQHRGQLLERHRDCEVQWKWWDDVYEMFREDMSAIGVHVETIYFSGFWSQGDGACFNGCVSDWAEFLTAAGKPELAEIASDRGPRFSWAAGGRYCHEHTVSFDDSELCEGNPYDEDDEPLRHQIWASTHPEGGPLHAAAEDLAEFLRDKMRELYCMLEAEYEHLTSDETTTEYILANCEDEIDELLAEQETETTEL